MQFSLEVKKSTDSIMLIPDPLNRSRGVISDAEQAVVEAALRKHPSCCAAVREGIYGLDSAMLNQENLEELLEDVGDMLNIKSPTSEEGRLCTANTLPVSCSVLNLRISDRILRYSIPRGFPVLRLHMEGSGVSSLFFESKHLMWVWLMWLRLADEAWHLGKEAADFPSWASGGVLSSSKVTVLNNEEECEGICTLDIGKKDAITCAGEEPLSRLTLDLSKWSRNVEVSCDSEPFSQLALEIDIDSIEKPKRLLKGLKASFRLVIRDSTISYETDLSAFGRWSEKVKINVDGTVLADRNAPPRKHGFFVHLFKTNAAHTSEVGNAFVSYDSIARDLNSRGNIFANMLRFDSNTDTVPIAVPVIEKMKLQVRLHSAVDLFWAAEMIKDPIANFKVSYKFLSPKSTISA